MIRDLRSPPAAGCHSHYPCTVCGRMPQPLSGHGLRQDATATIQKRDIYQPLGGSRMIEVFFGLGVDDEEAFAVEGGVGAEEESAGMGAFEFT